MTTNTKRKITSKLNPCHLAAQRFRKGQIKWCQHISRQDIEVDGKIIRHHCMAGALYDIVDKGDNEVQPIYNFASKYVYKKLGISMVGFNDDPKRKRVEVLKMLDEIGDAWDARAQDAK